MNLFFQPLDQFEIIFLGNLYKYLPLNNSLLYMFYIFIIIRFLFGVILIDLKIIPNN